MSILKLAFLANAGAAGSSPPFNGLDLDDTIAAENADNFPTPSTCSLTFNTDGTISYAANISSGDTTWASPDVVGSEWEIRATVTSGSVSSGTTGSWLDLGTARTWEKTATTITDAVTFTIEIRDVAAQTIQELCTVTLTATIN